MQLTYQEQEAVDVLEVAVEDDLCDLVVFNDDVNTFEHVINVVKRYVSILLSRQAVYATHSL